MARIQASGGGDGRLDVTVEPLTFFVDPVAGSDPVEPIRFYTQAEVDAYGTFATYSAAIDTVPSALRHRIRIQLADGHHLVGKDGLGKIDRFSADYIEGDWDAWLPHKIVGQLIIESKNGLVRSSGTPVLEVLTKTDVDNVYEYKMTVDPGLGSDDYQKYFVRVLTGSYAGDLLPILTHTGDTFLMNRRFKLVPGDQVEIVEAAAKLDVMIDTTLSPIIMQTNTRVPLIFLGVDFVSPGDEWSEIMWVGGDLWFVGGTRVLNDGGLWMTSGMLRCSNAIFDNYLELQTGASISTSAYDYRGYPWGFDRTSVTFFTDLNLNSSSGDSWTSRSGGAYYAYLDYYSLFYGCYTAIRASGYGLLRTYSSTVGCTYGMKLYDGARIRTRPIQLLGTSYDLEFDGQTFVSWGDISTPASGAKNSLISY